MATTPRTRKPGTAVIDWEAELAAQAKIAAAVEESTATGSWFSCKGGILSFNDSPLPGNRMAVVIVDSILENVFYEGDYDPDNIQSPTCFAFGRDDKTIKPHIDVTNVGNEQCGASGLCAGCPNNEFGSAEKGRGKACRNTRRLALIPAGNIDKNDKFVPFEDVEDFESSGIGYLKLPVTSIKGYAAFVKQIAAALGRPPHGVFAEVSVVPDAQTQFKVVFKALSKIPDEFMGVIMARHNEAKESIEFPYKPFDPEDAPPPKARGRGGKATPPARGARTPAKTRY